MRDKFYIILILLLLFNSLNAQDNPNQELRAAWVATVANLDWPNSWDKGDVEAQKASFIALIESLREVNINTIFLQIRTECDAFYQSDYEPWSRYLTGTQGKYPSYDPLGFAIDACHKRGVELHAWLNPYRINSSTHDSGSYYDEKHIYSKHPEWAIEYSDGKKILNPGLPDVQIFIKKIVGDIINNYDVDGIHFDDYFYAYSGTPSYLDSAEYNAYGDEYTNIGDFRRGSINKMVEGVMDTILAIKPYIRFGISPFGIYGNGINPPGITGLDAYNSIYCDPIAWLREGTVDYINPQLYWTTGGHQDFGTLLPWWADWAYQYNRDVYAGHGIYRLEDNPAVSYMDFAESMHEYKEYFNFSNQEMLRYGSWSLEEVVRQIEIVRENSDKNALGSVFFRAKDFDRVNNLKQFMHENAYQYRALLPEQYWKNSAEPGIVSNIRFEKAVGDSFYKIVWDNGDTLNRYAIYNTTNTDYPKIEDLIGLSFDNYFIPTDDVIYNNLSIAIVKINRFWKIGNLSTSYTVPKPLKPVLKIPNNNYNYFSRNDKFKWFTCKNAGSYVIEFSKDYEFSDIYSSFKIRDTILSAELLYMDGEEDYYWRVKSVNIAGLSEYSEVRKFTTGFPAIPSFIFPNNDEKDVPLDVEFKINVSDKTDSLFFQLSKGGSKFDEQRIVIDTVLVADDKFRVPKNLQKYTVYYARIKGANELGKSNWSEIYKFKTLMPVPDKTQIIQPKNNTGLNEDSEKIEFIWDNAYNASYYVFQISESSNFSSLIKDDNVYSGLKYTYYNPPKKKWMFARVAGKNIGGIGAWSNPIHFVLDNSVGIGELSEKDNSIFLFPNPCNDVFSIDFSKTDSFIPLKIEVFNSTGVKLLERNVVDMPNDKSIIFNVEQLICKPCFVRVISKKFTTTLKLIK